MRFNSLVGKVLVASPNLEDKFFSKSLVYIFAHDENGVLGIIVNYDIGVVSNQDLLNLINKKAKIKNPINKRIIFGGPLHTEKLFAISNVKKDILGNANKIAVHTDMKEFVSDFLEQQGVDEFLLIRGVSAWESKQLESEIERSDWFIIDADEKLIFSEKVKNKWASVMKKLGFSDETYMVSYTGNA